MNRTAVILISLGGPRNLDEAGPFMEAVMGRSAPPPLVAAIKERYRLIGGKSPLPELVKAQAGALELELGGGFRAYEGFLHSEPSIAAAFEQAVRYGASRVVGISMSPFFTEVTTGAYQRAFESLERGGVKKTFIPDWHDNPLFISAWQDRVSSALIRFQANDPSVAVIFTSHSIPAKYVAAGDPYQRRIEETVGLVAAGLNIKHRRIAWQSKGARSAEPWLGPEVEAVLDGLASEGFAGVLEIPIGFTCDHLETLYDIDIVHRGRAEKLGLKFERAESLNSSPLFIKALADVVKLSLNNPQRAA
jgi:protoporphyrin/coproporphyrin ferrochelatase